MESSFSQTLSEAEIKKIEESLRLDVDSEGYGPKDNDSLVSYLDSFRHVGISSSSTSGEDPSFDALFRLQQQDQDQYQEQQLTRSNYSRDENEKSTASVSASQHTHQPEQHQQQYYQPLQNNRPQLLENFHSLLPPPLQQPSSFQVIPNQVPNLQHHNMYNNMVSSQLGNAFPQPKFGYSMDLYTNNTIGGGNNHNTTNISPQYNHTANYNGVDNTNQSNGIIIPEAEAVVTDQSSSSSPMENGDYDWLTINQLDTPYSHPYIRSLPSEAAGVGGMTVVNNHTNNNNVYNNNPIVTNSNMMMTMTMPSAYTVGGGVSSSPSYTPDCNNNVNTNNSANNFFITTATPSPDYYEPMKNNGNNHHGNNNNHHHHNSGGRDNSDVGVGGTNGGSQSNYNNHFDYPFHSQQQQMNNGVFNNNNNIPLSSNANVNGTNGMRLNDYQIHLHNMMMQQQQQQQQFVSQQMSHSFPPMTMSNNFNHLHHQQKQYQQQPPQPHQQPLQNSFRYGSNDSNTTTVPMRMSTHNHHQQHQLATPSVAAEALTCLGGYSVDIGSGMTASSITGSNNGMVVKRCRSVLDGTDNEDVEDESCRLGSSRSNSSVSESYDEHDDDDNNNRYHHHTVSAAGANYVVNGSYNGCGGDVVGNGMNGNMNYSFNNNTINTNNNNNNYHRSVNSSPTKITSKHKLMRVSGSYSATTSPSVVQRRQLLQQQQGGMTAVAGGIGQQQQDKAPSKIRFEWKTHFAALLHFCNAHGHCKVPRTLEYTCEVPYNNSSSIIGGGINVGISMTSSSSVTAFSTSSPSVTVNNRYIVSNYNYNVSSNTYGYGNNSSVIIDGATNNGNNNASNNNLSNKSSATDTSGSTLGSSTTTGTTSVDTSSLTTQQQQPQQQTIIYTGKLGRWLDDQRKARKGKRTKLTPEREAILQRLVDEGKLLWDATELKPNEINKKRGDLNWPRAYAALLKFGEIHGHYNVPKRGNFKCELPDMPDENGSIIYDAKLGNWLYWQRELKKGRRCGLASERESQLQSLADKGKLTWDVSDMNASQRSQQRGATSWPRAYQALLVYGQEEGDYNVPDKKVYQCLLPNGDVYSANLGNWLNGQRKLKKSNAAAAASSSSSSSSSSTNKGTNNRGSNSQAQLPPEREKLLQNLADQGKFNW